MLGPPENGKCHSRILTASLVMMMMMIIVVIVVIAVVGTGELTYCGNIIGEMGWLCNVVYFEIMK